MIEVETEAAIKLTAERYYKTPCWYCSGDHWNDNCRKYKTAEERKQILNRRCFICLMRGHIAFECLSKKTQSYFYCKRKGHHHRSLCPLKFAACQDEDEQIKNLNEEPRQLATDSQNRTNIKAVPEKGLTLQQSKTETYWSQNNLEVENALWQQKLYITKTELAEYKREKTVLEEKISRIETEKQMIQTSFSRYLQITNQQRNEITQLRERLEQYKNSKNDFKWVQENIKLHESLISNKMPMILDIQMAVNCYPMVVEAEHNNKPEKIQDMRAGSNTGVEQNDFSKVSEDEATHRVKKTQVIYEQIEQPTVNCGAVEGLAKNLIKTWKEMTAYKRSREQKDDGDSDAFYPYDENLLNTWEKLFHHCLQGN